MHGLHVSTRNGKIKLTINSDTYPDFLKQLIFFNVDYKQMF